MWQPFPILVLLLECTLTWAHPAKRATGPKEFELSVTWEDHAPDGFERKMMLVNGQSPGPLLELDEDDDVVVTIHNQSPYETALHFHGLEMFGTAWSDGVPGLTQYPVAPGASFTHKFKVAQHGSYWYHGHFRGQIEDGFYGAIVIHPRADVAKPFDLISDDASTVRDLVKAEKKGVPLLVSDFIHTTSIDKQKITDEAGAELSCYDSILFNGKGRVDCLDRKVIEENLTDAQKLYLSVIPNTTMTDKACLPAANLDALTGGGANIGAIPRGIYEGCTATSAPLEVIPVRQSACKGEKWISIDVIGAINFGSGFFSIDEHDLWVYAIDGSYIQPQKVQTLLLGNGDRYSVFVKTHTIGDYKVRFTAASPLQMLQGHAVLSVQSHDGKTAEREDKPWVSLVGVPTSPDVVIFNQALAAPFPPEEIGQTADQTFVLNMLPDGGSHLLALNTTRLMPAEYEHQRPLLFDAPPFVDNNITALTLNNTWVDLVLVAAAAPQPPHPIHKHGSKMYHIGAGIGAWKWSSVEEAVQEVPELFNLVNPPKRDAFATTPAETDIGWTVLRYHVKDPGPWLLHCHIMSHMAGGMSFVLLDGVDKWPTVPDEYLVDA